MAASHNTVFLTLNCQELYIIISAVPVQQIARRRLHSCITECCSSHITLKGTLPGYRGHHKFRPLSNFTFTSKLLERIVCTHPRRIWSRTVLFQNIRVPTASSIQRKVLFLRCAQISTWLLQRTHRSSSITRLQRCI